MKGQFLSTCLRPRIFNKSVTFVVSNAWSFIIKCLCEVWDCDCLKKNCSDWCIISITFCFEINNFFWLVIHLRRLYSRKPPSQYNKFSHSKTSSVSLFPALSLRVFSYIFTSLHSTPPQWYFHRCANELWNKGLERGEGPRGPESSLNKWPSASYTTVKLLHKPNYMI